MSSEKNRLLMFVPSSTSAFGEQVELLVGHLRDSGVRVFLVVPDQYHVDRVLHTDDWVFMKRGGSKLVTGLRLLAPAMLWSLIRYLRLIKATSIYIYNGEAYPPTVLLLTVGRLLRIKCILSIHDAVPHPGKFFDQFYAILRLPSLCLATTLHTFSEHGRDALKRLFPKKSVIESPLLDLAEQYLRYPAGLYSGEKIILCFGRIEPYKDIPSVVASFSRLLLHHPDAKLRIIGNNGLGEELFLVTEGVINCTVVDRFLSPFELAEEMSRAHTCIFAYTEASHSGGAELALAFGCNVVATNVAAFEGLTGRTGVFLFEPRDVNGCSVAMAGAISAPRRSMCSSALHGIMMSNRERAVRFLEQAEIANEGAGK